METGHEEEWKGGSESGRERVPRDALGSVRERGGWRERSGVSKSSGLASGGWYPAKEESAVKGARTNDEAREPSGPYAREHATRVLGAMGRARP